MAVTTDVDQTDALLAQLVGGLDGRLGGPPVKPINITTLFSLGVMMLK